VPQSTTPYAGPQLREPLKICRHDSHVGHARCTYPVVYRDPLLAVVERPNCTDHRYRIRMAMSTNNSSDDARYRGRRRYLGHTAARRGLARHHHELGHQETARVPPAVSWPDGTVVRADVILWCTGFRSSLDHLAPLMLHEPSGGITMTGGSATQVANDPRVHLVGYGPSASTIGANRAAVAKELMAFVGEEKT
jgi:hypothetical protein